MFSVSKFLLLVLVIVAVWFGWRWVKRVGAVQRERLRERPAPRARSSQAQSAQTQAPRPEAPRMEAEDMEKCPECGAWVAPRSAGSCGRPGCPYGR